jgi:hypothetical protein
MPDSRRTAAPDERPNGILDRLGTFGPVLAVKLYRLTLEPAQPVPTLPCLDHEAMLHENIAPHLAAYVQDGRTGDLHEVVFIPSTRRIEIDTFSTWGECSPGSRDRLTAALTAAFAGWRVRVMPPSWWRGDRRVATACRAQVSVREVLAGDDIEAVTERIRRLQTIASLMEKQSRVASWGVRTVTGPLLPAAGVLTFFSLGSLSGPLGADAVLALRYAVVGVLGAAFLYYGLKAVQLTEMSNRVWKRTAEYSLILAERRRLAARSPDPGAASPARKTS